MQIMTNSPKEPLDLRTVPIWAIPQLAFIRDRLGGILLSVFEVIEDEDIAPYRLGFRIYLPQDSATYMGSIRKSDMNNPHIVPLYHTF